MGAPFDRQVDSDDLRVCETADIKADPLRFRDKLVQVDETVTISFRALSVGACEIEDETGIIVITSHRVLSARSARAGLGDCIQRRDDGRPGARRHYPG